MSHGFVHSVKVPRIYKTVANIVRRVCEEGASLKSLIYEQKHTNVSGIYALSVNTLQFNRQLDELFQRTQILTKEPRLDSWLAKVLITELLWGKQHLPGSSKPIQTILAYADKLQEESKSLGNTERSSVPKIGTLLLYSIAMFTLPFAAFFGVRHYMRLEFQTDTFVTNCVSVLAAVVTVNLIIACYVYQALHEDVDTKEDSIADSMESRENLNKKFE